MYQRMCVPNNCSDSFGEEDDDALLDLSTISALLQRSRASRSQKPLSIRAMMEQASTYSNMSRGASTKSPTPSSNAHAHAHQYMASSRSSKSVSPSSSIISSYGRATSPPTTDGYDSSMSGVALRQPRAKSTKKKRPAVLELQPEEPEEPEDRPEKDYRPTRKDKKDRKNKDYLRRSSPTVAEHFRWNPATSPPPPSRPSDNDLILASVAASANGYHYPRPREYPERSTLDDIEKSIDELTQEISGTPSPPLEDGVYENGEHHELRNQASSSSVRSQVITLPETARLRKQASRDKMSAQRGEISQTGPSNQQVQLPLNQLQTVQDNHLGQNGAQTTQSSQQQSQQPPPQTGPPPNVPPPPVPQQQQSQSRESTPVQHAQRAYHASSIIYDGSHQHPPRAQSLARQAQQQAAIDQFHEERSQQMNGTQSSMLPIRQRRIKRSDSDASRGQFTRFPMPPQPEEEDDSSSPQSDESQTSPPIPPSANSDQWPLSPEAVRMASSEHIQRSEREQESQLTARPLSPEAGQLPSQFHSRNMSQTSQRSQMTSRSYDLVNTPRQSVSGYGTATIYSTHTSTPRTIRSSGTGTIETVRSDGTGSTAGSVLSAQWYRPPRERTGLGPRVSHAEPVPWEMGAEAGELERLQQEQKRPMFSVFPRQDPSRQRDEYPAQERPRSPLMDEKFPISIKAMHGGPNIEKAPPSDGDTATQKSSSTEQSRAGAATPAKELLDLGGSKKPKKPKNSLLKDMISEYRSMSSKWYMEPYREPEVRELDWQERSQSSLATRPSTGSSNANASMITHASPSGLDSVQEQPYEDAVQSPITSPKSAEPQNRVIHVERGLHQQFESSNLQPMPPPKSSGNQSDKTNAIAARPSVETANSDNSSSRGSRMSLDSKVLVKNKKEKKMKKPSLLGDLLREYKEMTNTWYASPYQTDRPTGTTRSGSTSTGRS